LDQYPSFRDNQFVAETVYQVQDKGKLVLKHGKRVVMEVKEHPIRAAVWVLTPIVITALWYGAKYAWRRWPARG
jgi:hypothetical protein